MIFRAVEPIEIEKSSFRRNKVQRINTDLTDGLYQKCLQQRHILGGDDVNTYLVVQGIKLNLIKLNFSQKDLPELCLEAVISN